MHDALRLDLARWLLDAGAGASARAVLGSLRGPEANAVRARASSVALRPGFYGLGVMSDGAGLVVPLLTAPGAPRAGDSAFIDATERAMRAVRERLTAPTLPALHLDLADALGSFGESLGLGATLAFMAHCTGRGPAGPVLVTGALRDDGGIAPVEAVDAKVAAALRENASGPATILVPAGCTVRDARVETVGTLDQALLRAFGPERLSARADLSALDPLLERARALRDPERALALLTAVPMDPASDADRARLALEIGMHHRHAGRSEQAARWHAEGVALLERTRRVLGASLAETYELQAWATRLDQFEIDVAIETISQRLHRPFVLLHNEVRCRGVLAQALATAGRFDEALAIRTVNLSLQSESDALRRELPWTLCALALDAARAGRLDAFETFTERLCTLTSPGDTAQWRFNTAALVRGAVRLDRASDALAWLRGERAWHGAMAPRVATELLVGAATITEYPEVSVARAAIRALRRQGDSTAALSLAARVLRPRSAEIDLAGWIAGLAMFEGALARDAQGHAEQARERIASTRATLRELHPAASSYHRALFTADLSDLESALDTVWY